MIRYVALIALSLWFSDLVARYALAGQLSGDLLSLTRLLAYGGGAVVLVCLFAVKFLGPPPRAFPLRAVIVATMLGVMVYADVTHEHTRMLGAVNIGLALVLFVWYARE